MAHCIKHQQCKNTQSKEEALAVAQTVCTQAGARFTSSRRHVFEVLWGDHKALTAAEIMEKTGNKQPPMTYRSLEFLKERGLIHHIASLNAYVGCLHAAQENHIGQMLVCTNCRTVTEIDPEEAVNPLFAVAENINFNVQNTHIELLGICQMCQELERATNNE